MKKVLGVTEFEKFNQYLELDMELEELMARIYAIRTDLERAELEAAKLRKGMDFITDDEQTRTAFGYALDHVEDYISQSQHLRISVDLKARDLEPLEEDEEEEEEEILRVDLRPNESIQYVVDVTEEGILCEEPPFELTEEAQQFLNEFSKAVIALHVLREENEK
jgi:hypothetical protein